MHPPIANIYLRPHKFLSYFALILNDTIAVYIYATLKGK